MGWHRLRVDALVAAVIQAADQVHLAAVAEEFRYRISAADANDSFVMDRLGKLPTGRGRLMQLSFPVASAFR